MLVCRNISTFTRQSPSICSTVANGQRQMQRHETLSPKLNADHPDGAVQAAAGTQDEATAPAAVDVSEQHISGDQPPPTTTVPSLRAYNKRPLSTGNGDDNHNHDDGVTRDAPLLIRGQNSVVDVNSSAGAQVIDNDLSVLSSKHFDPSAEITRSPSPTQPFALPSSSNSSDNTVTLQPANSPPEAQPKNMIFSAAQDRHRRRVMATTSCLSTEEANLTSKDRAKQKDAIKRILATKVRDDWEWVWPQEKDGSVRLSASQSVPDSGLEGEDESGDGLEWRERDEWESNASESGDEHPTSGGAYPDEKQQIKLGGEVLEKVTKDPFRFSSPDGVGETLRQKAEEQKSRRRKRLLEEMKVNDGVACFTHRRNAWTGARYVRKSRGTRKSLVKDTASSETELESTSLAQSEDEFDLITEVPIAPPILPPNTPIRAGITEKVYTTIYDKVIIQAQTPICPINLSVIMKSCVEGWKRDGEWPPKATEAELGIRRIVGKDGGKDENGKERSVLRRSLQKVFGAVRGAGDRKSMQ